MEKIETEEQKQERIKSLMQIMEVIKSGYAGIMPNGNIVDRREFPKAVPIAKNSMFNTPEPKKLTDGR